MKKNILMVIITALLLTSCNWVWKKVSPTWMGTYYPGGRPYSDKTWINKFGFKSLEDCRVWAKSMIKNSADEYECGKNCEEDTPGLFACEMTVQ